MREHHGREISYELRCAIVTCRILYGATYEGIEQKTGVRQDTKQKLQHAQLNGQGVKTYVRYLHV